MEGVLSTAVGTDLLFENERIKVWQMVLSPGEECRLHRHEHDYVFIYTTPSPRMTFFLQDDPPLTRDYDEGFVQFAEVGKSGIYHKIRNDGPREHRQIIVEIKGPSRVDFPVAPQNNGRVR